MTIASPSLLSRKISLRRTLAFGAAAAVLIIGSGAAYHAHQQDVARDDTMRAVDAAFLAQSVSTYLVLHGAEIEGDAPQKIPPTVLSASQVFEPYRVPEIVVERAGGVLHAQATLRDTHIETFCDEKIAKPGECTSIRTDGTKVIGQITPAAAVADQAGGPAPPNAVSVSEIDPQQKDARAELTTTTSWAGLPAGLRLVGVIDANSLRFGNLALCIQHVIAPDGSVPLKLKEGGPQCLARAIVPPSVRDASQRFEGDGSYGRLVLAPGLPFVVYSRDPNDPRG